MPTKNQCKSEMPAAKEDIPQTSLKHWDIGDLMHFVV